VCVCVCVRMRARVRGAEVCCWNKGSCLLTV